MSSQKTVTLRKNNQNKSDSFAFFIAPGYAVIFILSRDAPYLNIQPYYRISIWHYSVMVFRYSHSLCQSFLIDSRKLPPAILLNTIRGTVAKLAMRQPFVLFKGLTFQKLCLPGAFRPGDHHNKMLRPGLCVVHASPQYL